MHLEAFLMCIQALSVTCHNTVNSCLPHMLNVEPEGVIGVTNLSLTSPTDTLYGPKQ